MTSRLLGSLVLRTLQLHLGGCKFNSRPPCLILGWVTILRQANYLSISPICSCQLNLLSAVEQQMNTSQSVVMLCGCGVKAGIAHSTCG